MRSPEPHPLKWLPASGRLQVYGELKPRGLQALILDAAVWLCCDDGVAHQLDTLCLGNMDGGAGTAAHVRRLLEEAGHAVEGDKAVRLSLDEAFFMAYALGILAVHDVVEGHAVALDTTVRGRLRGWRWGGGVGREHVLGRWWATWTAGRCLGPAAASMRVPAAHGSAPPVVLIRDRLAKRLLCQRWRAGAVAAAAAAPPRLLPPLPRPPPLPQQGGAPPCAVLHRAAHAPRQVAAGCLPLPLACLAHRHGAGLQGWIPRTGLQYGADFVLYQRHPALTHSDYTVLIVPLAPGQRPDLGWHDVQVSNRLSTQASVVSPVLEAVGREHAVPQAEGSRSCPLAPVTCACARSLAGGLLAAGQQEAAAVVCPGAGLRPQQPQLPSKGGSA